MNANIPEFKLIIGLGNPDLPAPGRAGGRHGKKYEQTYHNVGHLFIEYLKDNSTLYPLSSILKSDVYMNESGTFVSRTMKKSGTKPGDLLIVHDDSDIYIGEYKFSFERGSAGHKGIESIVNALGTTSFWRLRIGIRPKPGADLPAEARRAKAGEFVLKKINAKDKETLRGVFNRATQDLTAETSA